MDSTNSAIKFVLGLFLIRAVALHTSAWIETSSSISIGRVSFVALHTSAWIETVIAIEFANSNASHSIRVRGLKLFGSVFPWRNQTVALHTSAWIETPYMHFNTR